MTWFILEWKYLIIGLLAIILGLPACLMLDALIDLFDQWLDQEENGNA